MHFLCLCVLLQLQWGEVCARLLRCRTLSPFMAFPPPEQVELLYNVPEWSAEPPYHYRLEVIKSGVIIEEVPIHSKGHFLMGRNTNVCDICAEHPSISRQHCVVQHKADGEVFLYDLGSTHGTFIMKNRLRPRAYARLCVGDVVRLGQSQRMYVLQSDDEIPEVNIAEEKRKQKERVKERDEALLRRRLVEEEKKEEKRRVLRENVTWGFDEDASSDSDSEEEGGNDEELLGEGGLPVDFTGNEEDLQEFLKKRRKILEERKEKKWKEEEIANRSKRRILERRLKEERADEEDEFYDRTAQTRAKHAKMGEKSKGVETVESLEVKKQRLAEQRMVLLKEIAALESSHASASEEDALDAFMSAVTNQVNAESRRKLEAEAEELMKEELRIQKIISIARPALPEFEAPAPQPPPTMMPPPPPLHTSSPSTRPVSRAPIFPSPRPPPVPTTTSPPIKPQDEDREHAEPQKTEKIEKTEKTERAESVQRSLPGAFIDLPGPVPGSEETAPLKYGLTVHPERRHRKPPKKAAAFVDEVEEWFPPDNQTGDGRTRLNEKLGY